MSTSDAPEARNVIWFSRLNAGAGRPWYVQTPDGVVHEAAWFEAEECVGLFEDEGLRKIPEGPRAVLIARGKVKFG